MADFMSKEKRSIIMSQIRSEGTVPETRLFQIVSEILPNGLAIESNVSSLPGTPDILLPDLDLAIFCDGCFFHFCPKHGTIPDSNREYWEPKLRGNVRRDRRTRRKLRSMGYSVWRIWEHDLREKTLHRGFTKLERRLERRLKEYTLV